MPRPASRQPDDRSTACLDPESGLYHLGHFLSILRRDLSRLDRIEKPLCLVLVRLTENRPEIWPALGGLLRQNLRQLDMAARLAPDQAAVLLPDTETARARRWLEEFSRDAARSPLLSQVRLDFGLVQARPWEGRQAEDMLAQVLESNLSEDVAGPLSFPEEASPSAVAAEERNLLFEGFQSLFGHQTH